MEKTPNSGFKKHTYTLLGILIPLGPIALSFDQKVNFIQYLIPVLGAMIIGAFVYILWDVFAVKKKHWRFNDEYVGSLRIAHLPLGEWLFFIGVPYACLFIYEVVLAYFGDSTLEGFEIILPFLTYGLAVFAALNGVFQKKGYTSWVSYSVAFVLIMVSVFAPGIWVSTAFWTFMGLSLIAFLIVNGVYVNLPTIYYNGENFSGKRIIGIPIEDFFYNFSYLVLLFFSYLLIKSIPGILLGAGQ